METVNFLALLWGFSFIIIALALLLKPKQTDHVWKIAEQEATVFLLGIMTLILGIASILAFNVWEESWRVLITLLGWLTAIKGAAILFLPEHTHRWYAKMKTKKDGVVFALAAFVIFGCILIYFGFAG